MVLEATPPKVKVTSLHEFLFPDDKRKFPPKSVVGRLKSDYRKYIPEALKEGLSLVGKDYDDIYDLDNDKYYCSELIYFMFLKANGGQPVFQLNKMTFKSDTTDRILPEWQSYFDKRGVTVPEGKPGINPLYNQLPFFKTFQSNAFAAIRCKYCVFKRYLRAYINPNN